MHYELPIERLVRRNDTRFQLGFANEARARVSAGDGAALTASQAGLHVLAGSEEGLAAPIDALRAAYGGARLDIGPPRVRLIDGVQVREPIMHVRIQVPQRHLGAVRALMRSRRAGTADEYLGTHQCVLRYEAPLARLLGLHRQLQSATDGSARHWVALSHYALVTGDPGGDAA